MKKAVLLPAGASRVAPWCCNASTHDTPLDAPVQLADRSRVKIDWLSSGGARWIVVSAALFGACGGERPPPEPAPPPAVAAPLAARPPVVRMRAPLSDVATLERQPDGSFKRTCGEPRPEVRAMLEGVLQARRAARR